MFFDYTDSSIRYTGRFAPYVGAMTATAPGAYFEIAFQGSFIRLCFDVKGNPQPYPHLWVCLDSGTMTETPLDKYLRVNCAEGAHTLKVILKGSVEVQSRFFHPLEAKISFVGYESAGAGKLQPDERKTIEFIGDSITEGVLIDAFLECDEGGQNSRPIQDDVTATYAWLTAEHFNLRDLHMGYGAVGVTQAGQGGVPKAAEAYPWCFQNAGILYGHPDYILINHGANDRHQSPQEYIREYEKFLYLIRGIHPQAVITCLSAFMGVYAENLEYVVKKFNAETGDQIHFIDGSGWIPPEPRHPLRDGHRIIAEHLIKALQDIIK